MKLLTKILLSGTLALAILLFFSSPTTGQTSYTWIWSSDVHFGLSSLDTRICFDKNIYLGNLTFVEGTAITYRDILLDGHVDSITLGTQTANMTLTYLAPTRIDYNVTGSGTQTINIGLAPNYVLLDGTPAIEGMGYSYNSGTKLVTVTGATEDAVLTFLSSSGSGATYLGFTDPLFQYLLEGNFIGFIVACYTSVIGSVFYAICVFFVSAVIYIRQKSLFIVSLIWLFVGGAYIGLFWQFSPVAVWFFLLGVAGIVAEFILVWRRGH